MATCHQSVFVQFLTTNQWILYICDRKTPIVLYFFPPPENTFHTKTPTLAADILLTFSVMPADNQPPTDSLLHQKGELIKTAHNHTPLFLSQLQWTKNMENRSEVRIYKVSVTRSFLPRSRYLALGYYWARFLGKYFVFCFFLLLSLLPRRLIAQVSLVTPQHLASCDLSYTQSLIRAQLTVRMPHLRLHSYINENGSSCSYLDFYQCYGLQ